MRISLLQKKKTKAMLCQDADMFTRFLPMLPPLLRLCTKLHGTVLELRSHLKGEESASGRHSRCSLNAATTSLSPIHGKICL